MPTEHALSPLDDNPRERGCDADARRRRRDAALQRERQKRYQARPVSSARAHTLDGLAPADATPDARRSTAPQPHREHQRHYQTHHTNFPLSSARTRHSLASRGQRTRAWVRRHSPLSSSLPRPLQSPLPSPHDPIQVDIVLARLPPERLSVPFKDYSPYYAILAVLRSKDPIPPDDANIWPACLLSSLPVVLSRPLS